MTEDWSDAFMPCWRREPGSSSSGSMLKDLADIEALGEKP
jgi:hypothetical protein